MKRFFKRAMYFVIANMIALSAAQAADTDVAIQNAVIVTLSVEQCGYTVKPNYADAISLIWNDNRERFDFYYQTLGREFARDQAGYCRKMRTDYLARMIQW